ncbi:hypothetical protein D3C78_1511990 [compost metagenome]
MGRYVIRQQVTETVQALKQLDVAFQAVNERAVEHMATDLRQGRLQTGVAALGGILPAGATGVAADADHEHAIGPQV